MSDRFRSCAIVYGANDIDALRKMSMQKHVVIVEPRKAWIDTLREANLRNATVLAKLLVSTNVMTEQVFFHADGSIYLECPVDVPQCKKESCFSTSIYNIIKQCKIQNVQEIIINLKVERCERIFDNVRCINQVISTVTLPPASVTEALLSSQFFGAFKILTNNTPSSSNEPVILQHKNLGVALPNVCMYNITSSRCNLPTMQTLVSQYKLSLLSAAGFVTDWDAYEPVQPPKGSFYHERVIFMLEKFFEQESASEKKHEIVLQFNPSYLQDNETFQILYPIKNNVLYINRRHDVIYASKTCMEMLYQILKSKYFTDFITEKQRAKPSMFELIAKTYFYEYIAKSFIVKDY